MSPKHQQAFSSPNMRTCYAFSFLDNAVLSDSTALSFLTETAQPYDCVIIASPVFMLPLFIPATLLQRGELSFISVRRWLDKQHS